MNTSRARRVLRRLVEVAHGLKYHVAHLTAPQIEAILRTAKTYKAIAIFKYDDETQIIKVKPAKGTDRSARLSCAKC